MIEEILIEIAEQGYSPKDIKDTVIKVLHPFFDNSDSLNQYACESQLLSAFEFFIRYHYESEYSCAVKPPVRQTGNRLSGLTETICVSLLT